MRPEEKLRSEIANLEFQQIVRETDRELRQTQQEKDRRRDERLRSENANLRKELDWKNLDCKVLKDDFYKLLVKKDAEIRSRLEAKEEEFKRLLIPPLFLAVKRSQIEMVELLVKAGADIHVRDRNNETTLHVATINRNPDMIRWLITEGVDVVARNDFGETPLNLMSRSAYLSEELPYSYRSYVTSCEILIRHMVLLNCRESDYISCKPYSISDVEYIRHTNRVLSFRRRCETELEDMKKREVSRGVTLYNVMTGGNLSSYVRNENVRRVLQEGGKKHSEIYGDVLDVKFREGLDRFRALRVGWIVTSHFDGLVPDLAFVLADYLSNDDIKNLRKAAIQIMDSKKRKRVLQKRTLKKRRLNIPS